MLIHGYEFQSDFAKKYAADGVMDGLRQGIQIVYETRFGAVPPALEEALARVHYGDELRRLVAVVGAGSPEEIAAAVRAAAG